MANTAPIHIIALPPYRRNTAVRHRRAVTTWQVDRRVRFVKAWLAQPVRATRAQHAKVAGLYGAVAVLSGLVATVVIR